MDGCGRLWTGRPSVPGCVDACGRLWTLLGDLRIRRLGVRVPPGVLLKSLCRKGFMSKLVRRLSDVWEPFATESCKSGWTPTDLSTSRYGIYGRLRTSTNGSRRPGYVCVLRAMVFISMKRRR